MTHTWNRVALFCVVLAPLLGMAQSSPSKEYIRLGHRVIAVEAPAQANPIVTSNQSNSFDGIPGAGDPPAQTIGLSFPNGQPAPQYSASVDQTFLQVTPPNGVGAAQLTVSAHVGTLTAGIYTGNVTINVAGASAPKKVAFTLTVRGATPNPVTLSGGANNFQTISIFMPQSVSWTAVSNASSWLRVNGLSSVTGSGSGSFAANSANVNPSTTASRSGSITITPSSGPAITIPVSQTAFQTGTIPTITVTPLSSSVPGPVSQMLSVKFDDPNGPGYMAYSSIMLNNVRHNASGCFMAFYPYYNSFSFLTAAGGTSYTLGQPGQGIARSATCQLDPGASSVVYNGTSVTLNLALTVLPGGVGTLHTYVLVQDQTYQANANSGLPVPNADWTVHPEVNTAPTTVIATPGTTHTQTLNITISDVNGYLYTSTSGAGGLVQVGSSNCLLWYSGQYASLSGYVGGTYTSSSGNFGSGALTIPGTCSVDLSQSSLGPVNTADPNGAGSTYPVGFNDLTLALKFTLDPSVTGTQSVVVAAGDLLNRVFWNGVNWILNSQMSPQEIKSPMSEKGK